MIELPENILELIRQRDGAFRNMREVAAELSPDHVEDALTALRDFLYEYDDLDFDEEGNVYETSWS